MIRRRKRGRSSLLLFQGSESEQDNTGPLFPGITPGAGKLAKRKPGKLSLMVFSGILQRKWGFGIERISGHYFNVFDDYPPFRQSIIKKILPAITEPEYSLTLAFQPSRQHPVPFSAGAQFL